MRRSPLPVALVSTGPASSPRVTDDEVALDPPMVPTPVYFELLPDVRISLHDAAVTLRLDAGTVANGILRRGLKRLLDQTPTP